MARSQLLKDLVSGTIEIETILLRLKVVLSDLDNESIIDWVNGELKGYNDETVPSYRVLKGSPYGTFIVNFNTKYTDQLVPLRALVADDEVYDKVVTLTVSDSLVAVQNILNGENRENYSKIISTEFCHSISRDQLQLAGMRIKFSSNQLDSIVSNVKSKLVEIIMQLEEQFVNLDNLDIKEQVEEDSSKKEQAIYNIQNIIYDGSINVGDKNKIGKSKLGHFFSGGK